MSERERERERGGVRGRGREGGEKERRERGRGWEEAPVHRDAKPKRVLYVVVEISVSSERVREGVLSRAEYACFVLF